MELNLNLQLDENGEQKIQRVKEAEMKKVLKEYQPTHDEIWVTGYMTHTGKHKPGIYAAKNSDADLRKLHAVREAIEKGEIGVGVDDMKKFTKAHALRLYVLLKDQQREGLIEKMLANRPKNYILVQEMSQLFSLCEKLGREKIISLDTETTGLNLHGVGGGPRDKVVGFVITLPSYNLHYYVPFGHTTGEKQLPENIVVEALRPFIESTSLKKVLHNAKYDMHVMRNNGLVMGGFYFDTMVAMSLLNENEPSYALKNLANKYGSYFGYEDNSATYEELFGKGGFQDTPLDIGSIYASKDGHLTWLFYEFIMEQFEKMPEIKKYYFEIEQPITEVSVEMEQNGFAIDFDYAGRYAVELEEDVTRLGEELKHYFGDININSPVQLSEVLYDKLKLPDVSKKRSTDANTLKKLAKQHKGCELLLEYRDLNKLLTTYVRALPEKVSDDGRLRGEFKQTGTVTGRYSSSNPNLQNLPKKARKLVKVSEGKLILGIDFSQIEPRVLASMSGDKALREPYINDRDIYSEVASKVFNKPIEECGDGSPERKASKVIILAVMYGMLPKSLGDMLKIPVYEAEKFINDFFEGYGGVKQFVADQNKKADTQGFVSTLFGRKRRFIGHQQIAAGYWKAYREIEAAYGSVPTDIWGSTLPRPVKMEYWKWAKPYGSVKRQSVNAVIQGTAAEIMKKAMILLWKHCLKMGYKFLATVHDEVLIEVPDTITIEEVEALEELMCTAVLLEVPIKVDVEVITERWGEGMSKADWFGTRG